MISIETQKLTKKYKNKVVVNDLNIKIEDKMLYSLLGVNGAGKTTTIKMITNVIKPTSGQIIINEKYNNYEFEARNIMNISPQETAVAPNLTVKENLDFMCGVYSIKNKKDKINELVKLFKLEEVLNEKAKKLSGGFQRRLSIACALINEPKILFLDEPTLGLDVIAKHELWDIIKVLKKKITIILTTHYMEEAEKLSDKIGILFKGKLICEGTAKELIKKAKVKTFEEAFISLTIGGKK